MQDNLMSLTEASAQLSVSRDTLYRLMRTGKLQSVRLWKRRLIVSDSVERLIRERSQQRRAMQPAAGKSAVR